METRFSILFFIDSLTGGGAERFTTILANNLAQRDHTVSVVTIGNPSSTEYSLSQRVTRISLSGAQKSNNIASAITNNLQITRRLRTLVNETSPDIVISVMTQSNVITSFACLGFNLCHIACERNYPPLQSMSMMWKCLRRLFYFFPHKIVTQTRGIEEWIINNTMSRSTAVIPNPVIYPLSPDATDNEIEHLTKDFQNRKIILAVGRLVDQKQFDRLIVVFQSIANRNNDWILVIAGDGKNRDALAKLILDKNMHNRIYLVGPQAKIGYFYQLASIFVLTSKFEGYPNALLEAMSYGTAVVSYDCKTGPSSIIEHEYNGLLVELNNEYELRVSLEKLIGDKLLREKLARNAIEIRDSHSIRTTINLWESLFYELRDKNIGIS